MAAELKTHLNEQSELVASHGGVFEIIVDGKLVFSKKSSGRFPDDGEVLRLIRAHSP